MKRKFLVLIAVLWAVGIVSLLPWNSRPVYSHCPDWEYTEGDPFFHPYCFPTLTAAADVATNTPAPPPPTTTPVPPTATRPTPIVTVKVIVPTKPPPTAINPVRTALPTATIPVPTVTPPPTKQSPTPTRGPAPPPTATPRPPAATGQPPTASPTPRLLPTAALAVSVFLHTAPVARTACIPQHAARPVALCPSGSGSGWWLYFIGNMGRSAAGPYVPYAAEMMDESVPVDLVNQVHPFSGHSLTVVWVPIEQNIEVRTAYSDGKPYVFNVSEGGVVSFEEW